MRRLLAAVELVDVDAVAAGGDAGGRAGPGADALVQAALLARLRRRGRRHRQRHPGEDGLPRLTDQDLFGILYEFIAKFSNICTSFLI